MAHVFISYSREDLAFVRDLKLALEGADRQIWVDLDDIPATAEWMAEVNTAIEAADAFLFVLSPSSLASRVCALELSHAVRQNKRLVPILRREVSTSDTPPALAKLNWLFFRENDDFDDALASLSAALDTDLDWVRAHTRLLTRALEWDIAGRKPSALLRGAELSSAEAMLGEQAGKEPPLTELQARYVLIGCRRAKLRRGWLLGAVAVIALMTTVAVVVIDNTRQRALQERAERLVKLVPEEKELRLLLAVEAVTSVDPPPLAARQNLINALFEQGLIPRLDVKGPVRQVVFGPDSNSLYVVASAEEAVRRWNFDASVPDNPLGFDTLPKPWEKAALAADTVVARIPQDRVKGSVTIAVDAERLAATAETDSEARVWKLKSGTEPSSLEELPLDGRNDTVVGFSPDGRWLVTRRYDESDAPTLIWDLDAKVRTPLRLPAPSGRAKLAAAAFSPNGRRLATAMLRLQGVRLWITDDFKPDEVLRPDLELPATSNVEALAFGPEGRWLFAGTELWDLDRAGRETLTQPVKELREEHPQGILTVAFSADGQYLVTSGRPDGRPEKKVNTRLWDRRALSQESLVLPHYELNERDTTSDVIATAFSPDSQWLATASSRNPSRIYLWPIQIKAMVEIVRRRLRRNFRAEEWEEGYFRDEAFDPDRPFGGALRARD